MTFTYVNLSYLFVGALSGIIISYALRPKGKDIKKVRQDFTAYMQSINYIIDDETDNAIKELTKLVKMNPELIAIYLAIGNLFRKRGELNRALIIHKSLLARPHIDDTLKRAIILSIGIDYDKAGFHQKAAENFKILVDRDRYDNYAMEMLKEAYEKNLEWNEALNVLRRSKSTKRNEEAHVLVALGKAKKVEGNKKAAKSFFQKAIKTNSDCFEAYCEQAMLSYETSDNENALELLKTAVTKNRRFISAASDIIIKISDDYLEFYKKLLKEFPDSAELLFDLMFHLNSDGRLKDAKNFLNKAQFSTDESRKLLNYWKLRLDMLENPANDKTLILLLDSINEKPVFKCSNCGFKQKDIFWKCPQCRKWDTVDVIY